MPLTIGMADGGKGGFLVKEADGTTHLPTTKNGSIDRGLCGAAWAALHAGFRGQTYDGPNKAEALAKLKKIYAAQGWPLPDTGMSAEMVTRTGLIFTAGEYPDKGLTITEADLAAAVAAFTESVDAELEHITTAGTKTFLDGKLGQLVEVWADGPHLYGKMAVPSWLDPLWAEFGRKVSTVWSTATKTLTRIGLVLNPRVEDAAVMSAYAAFAKTHDTPHGQRTIQGIHDMAAQAGAVCMPPPVAGFVSKHESSGLQAIHDMSCEHGADCPGSVMASQAPAYFAGSRHSAADLHDIQQIHELSTKQGAVCAPATMSSPPRRFGMQLDSIKFWKGLGRRARDEARQEGIKSVPEEEVFTVLEDTERAEMERIRAEQETVFAAKLAQAEQKLKDAETAHFAATAMRLQGEAAAFADGLIVGNKLLPAEREGLIAALSTAGMDDAAHGVVTFANGASGSRVEQLKAMYASRPAHGLTKEQLDGRGNLTVVMGGQTADTSPDSYDDDRLLRMTPAGKQAVARKKA